MTGRYIFWILSEFWSIWDFLVVYFLLYNIWSGIGSLHKNIFIETIISDNVRGSYLVLHNLLSYDTMYQYHFLRNLLDSREIARQLFDFVKIHTTIHGKVVVSHFNVNKLLNRKIGAQFYTLFRKKWFMPDEIFQLKTFNICHTYFGKMIT